jgi:hypothetical protein
MFDSAKWLVAQMVEITGFRAWLGVGTISDPGWAWAFSPRKWMKVGTDDFRLWLIRAA